MKRKICFLLPLFLFALSLQAFAYITPGVHKENLTQEEKERLAEFEAKIENFSDKQKEKLQKKLSRIEAKIDAKNARIAKKAKEDRRAGTSKFGLGLTIILVGAIVAILGFAGIADILISIGVIVLLIGLILWLLANV